MLSILREAPTPHSPAMAMPYKARNAIRTVTLGREAGCEFEDRVGENGDDEGGSTSPAVSSTAEDERVECPAEKARRDRVLLLAGPPGRTPATC